MRASPAPAIESSLGRPVAGDIFTKGDMGLTSTREGISLRDWFAGQIVAGALGGGLQFGPDDEVRKRARQIARAIYIVADEFVEESRRHAGNGHLLRRHPPAPETTVETTAIAGYIGRGPKSADAGSGLGAAALGSPEFQIGQAPDDEPIVAGRQAAGEPLGAGRQATSDT